MDGFQSSSWLTSYLSSQIDAVIENLTLESANLLPNVFEFEARNYFKVSPYDAIHDQSKHSFWVSFSQIQCDLKDVAFCELPPLLLSELHLFQQHRHQEEDWFPQAAGQRRRGRLHWYVLCASPRLDMR